MTLDAQSTRNGRPSVNLIEAEPDLAHGLSPGEAAALRQHAIVPALDLVPGPWEPDPAVAGPERALGLLVISGLIVRELRIGEAAAAELVGSGDLVRPCHEDEVSVIVEADAAWSVLEKARVAVLDQRVAALCGRFPQFVSNLLGRGTRRARALTTHSAISHMTRVDSRLLLLLWNLADRWGKVAPEGVTIPMRLTHEMLAKLVGARRPSVSTAMSDLSRRGLLTARRGGFIVLHGDPPPAFSSQPESVEAERVLASDTIS
ncbi:MAG TPA: Crp/Fnr family transcriptional regulator [Thermoleophilaceae bacterium]|nr:Crp/Fnr family transcriptional regulator [Thermoleophilaceae bacterium]